MQNHLAVPGRRTSRKVHNLLNSEFINRKVFVTNEDNDDSSPDEKVPKFRSAFPTPQKGSGPSFNNSPEKGNQDSYKFDSRTVGKSDRHVHGSSEAQRPSEWVFEEEDLPDFPNGSQSLRILVVTWNLYGKKPKEGLEKLFNTEKVKHHIISIGTEECLRSIPASTFYESKSYWIDLLRSHLQRDYVMLKSHSMNALHLAVFVHRSIFPLVRGIESDEVRTGIGNILGNKGGIGITLKVCDTSFLFLNCHLTSGQKKIKQRNEDFERIMNELELPSARVAEEKRMRQRSSIVDRFDYIFWSGDFNYRVNQTRESTIEYIRDNKFEALLHEDQMTIEKGNTSTFDNFLEGQIKFPPTYKYQVDSDMFDNKKNRVPSWTDRILYRNRDRSKQISQLSYQSLPSVQVSDHRPVFSQFVATFETTREEIGENLVKMKTKACNMF